MGALRYKLTSHQYHRMLLLYLIICRNDVAIIMPGNREGSQKGKCPAVKMKALCFRRCFGKLTETNPLAY